MLNRFVPVRSSGGNGCCSLLDQDLRKDLRRGCQCHCLRRSRWPCIGCVFAEIMKLGSFCSLDFRDHKLVTKCKGQAGEIQKEMHSHALQLEGRTMVLIQTL